MVKKISYQEMRKHLDHLEDRYGEGVLNKSWEKIHELVDGTEYQADIDAIITFGEQSRTTYISQETLSAVQWLIKQGLFKFEIADKVKIESAEMDRILNNYPGYRDLYRSKRALRRKRRIRENAIRRKQVGKRIAIIRKTLNLSKTEFGERLSCKVHAPTIKNWETGQSMPNEQYLKAIAELGHVSMEELTETGR
ncbi:MAG: helix-turn-helix domain-containing protein [Limosilactobacillus pontis]|uniref:helix-turn-helix domain-containing protein n=1 Tax=Limosilactobacillus pontis TaxID=35787 RepID=UPI0039A0F613